MSDISTTDRSQNIPNKSVIEAKKSDHNAVYFNIDILLQRIKELNSLVNYQHITKSKHANIYHFYTAHYLIETLCQWIISKQWSIEAIRIT